MFYGWLLLTADIKRSRAANLDLFISAIFLLER
jgi:hypothetical protein